MIYLTTLPPPASCRRAAQAAMKTMDRGLRQSVVPVSLGSRPPRGWGSTGNRWPGPWAVRGKRSILPREEPRGTTGPLPWRSIWAATRAGISSPRRSSTPRCFSPARRLERQGYEVTYLHPRRLRPGSGGGPGGRPSGRTPSGVQDAGETRRLGPPAGGPRPSAPRKQSAALLHTTRSRAF